MEGIVGLVGDQRLLIGVWNGLVTIFPCRYKILNFKSIGLSILLL